MRSPHSSCNPRAVWLVIACLAASASSHAQSVPVATPLVVTARTLTLRVDYTGGSLAGTEALTLRNTGSTPVHVVPLLLNRLMRVSNAGVSSAAAPQFRQDVVVFVDDPALQVNQVTVTLARPVAAGASITLTLAYGGILVGYVETGSLYIHDRVDSAFTIIREDAYAFPALGVPSHRLNRAMGFDHPFDFDVSVTVPSGYMVATGGRAMEPVRRDSMVTWRYRTAEPAPVLNVAIARYRTLDRPGTRIYYFPQDSAGAVMVDLAVAGAMAKFADWFGPLSQTLPVTIIEIPEGWGSQASLAGGIIETADAFRDRAQLFQLYHELSHLWNLPDRDAPSARWNEGLAMFLQWRMAAELDGWTGFDAQINRTERNLRASCAAPSPCGTVPFADYGKAEATDLSYSVGLAMFYALDKTLGHDAFDRAYRAFLARNAASGATPARLAAAFHEVSPAADAIFADWFTTTRWYARLSSGQSLRQILEGYAKP